jgi:hypothetical protein
VTPGPHLAAVHAVLMCGQFSTLSNLCTWAGPGPAGGKPVFGAFWVWPQPTNGTPNALPDANMAAFADRLFAVLTAG